MSKLAYESLLLAGFYLVLFFLCLLAAYSRSRKTVVVLWLPCTCLVSYWLLNGVVSPILEVVQARSSDPDAGWTVMEKRFVMLILLGFNWPSVVAALVLFFGRPRTRGAWAPRYWGLALVIVFSISAVIELALSRKVAFQFVDQHGAPVPAVELRVDRQSQSPLFPYESGGTRTGDQSGKVVVKYLWLQKLVVKGASAEGYEIAPNFPVSCGPAGSGTSSPTHILVQAWKKGAKQRLDVYRYWSSLTPDGRVYTLDLKTNQKSEGKLSEGDLFISIARPARASPAVHYPWSFTLEIPDGGLIETNATFLHLAPTSGYSNACHFHLPSDATNWTEKVKKSFYIHRAGRKNFGSLVVEIKARNGISSAVFVQVAINTNGSPVLE
jgi:hypothetical protein